jgi:hypothetical protein
MLNIDSLGKAVSRYCGAAVYHALLTVGLLTRRGDQGARPTTPIFAIVAPFVIDGTAHT